MPDSRDSSPVPRDERPDVLDFEPLEAALRVWLRRRERDAEFREGALFEGIKALEDALVRGERVVHPLAYMKKAALCRLLKLRKKREQGPKQVPGEGLTAERSAGQDPLDALIEEEGAEESEDERGSIEVLVERGRLTELEAEVFRLRAQHLIESEIAVVVGTTPKSVERALARARRKLRRDGSAGGGRH